MALLKTDPTTQLAFSVHENRGVFALLLGSGLSRSAEIPTGWEITLDLIRRVAAAQGVEAQPNWEEWYRDKTGTAPSYSALLEEIASSPQERRAILQGYIEPTADDQEKGHKTPTKAHHAIAKMVRSGHVRVIITTNFDRLLENALREQGVEPTVVSSVDALAGAEPLSHSNCFLVKLHGDYKDARILNTEQELSSYPEPFNRLLDRVFDEYGLIVCGWSGAWDLGLRTALLRAFSRRYPMYWAVRGALGSDGSDLMIHRRAREIVVNGADEFFLTLQQRLDVLESTQYQNPRSVELLVNGAKRLVGRAEQKVQLDELLSGEVARVLDELNGEAFSSGEPWSVEAFRLRVRRYESVAESLVRICGVLGRWGGNVESALVLDVIASLWTQAGKVSSGTTVWLSLRSYVAVLCFTAFGIGLAKAANWPLLHRLFSLLLSSEYRDRERAVEKLFLWTWAGSEQQLWQKLDGLDRRKTPLSDHLLEVMTKWKDSFVGVEASFELLFEKYEVLGALAHFESNDLSDVENHLNSTAKSAAGGIWMPMGRSGWRESSARQVLQELGNDPVANELVKAGFARKSPNFLELFIKNFELSARVMRW